MEVQSLLRGLHPLEIKVLLYFAPGDVLSAARLITELAYVEGQANQAFAWLVAKQLAAETSRSSRLVYEVTPLGVSWLEQGSPEERIVKLLREQGALAMPAICQAIGMEQKDAGTAYGKLAKEGVVTMDAEKRVSLLDAHKALRSRLLRQILARAQAEGGLLEEASLVPEQLALLAEVAKKRGAADAPFRVADRETVLWSLLPAAAEVTAVLRAQGVSGDELGAITQDILESGSWKNVSFRTYNISSRPARLLPGRHNPYVQFLDSVKDKLVSLGFQEFDGGLVETEFWNGDALFMPQFHAARDIHDVYYVADPQRAKSIEEPYLSRVAATHENGGNTGSRGWRYGFDRDFTKRLVLRSQGTVLSARQLPTAEVPGKYFGIARCFRYDKVDATHLSDFYQTEGIVLGEDVSLRTLLGFLEMFAVEVAGAKEVKYVPGYFPFTEPSVEVHIKHPVLGWFELGGAGIFRPEVTEPLGVTVPVLAWGIGIDRMALMALGLNDIRELFSYDIDSVRLRRAGLVPGQPAVSAGKKE
ncbi:MAG: phenylalanine--tRNA ligase subunit alpha [Spirochaetes bacterium GWD1_61_31]|nr:MAG: phenylalanine--tRNA ligase subunit alpha [Spirochaetes bacterium GWB1_60_80]OHD34918.1 MAG: phenylalanine--tRNA ligase subunit alpha [Spirochaetes bacterium GWC1_61_12]OHD37053.1 MAG: phenylalanine--tRNA ligase subunit alpha [Spirochaetes bacterium GWD1_61_31]OHD45337.1 MAG: phenylalanine--tRNA ligase subunit alpha [Spirochaetes bacterium GWE1_60_18]OHD61089.1 MAG: phenylalanine--tRNA ligase subunit alpha [Spirochaetes bacterium GWF1_60_12]HAP42751.1 phenylalanine--tRNA ligase subunit 